MSVITVGPFKKFISLYYILRVKGIKGFIRYAFGTPTLEEQLERLCVNHTVDGVLHKDVAYCLGLSKLIMLSALRDYRIQWGLRIKLSTVCENAYVVIDRLNYSSHLVQTKGSVPERIQKSRKDSKNLKVLTLDDFLVSNEGQSLKPVEVYNAIVHQLESLGRALLESGVIGSKYPDYYARQLTHLLGDVDVVLMALIEVQNYARSQSETASKPSHNRVTKKP